MIPKVHLDGTASYDVGDEICRSRSREPPQQVGATVPESAQSRTLLTPAEMLVDERK